MENRYDLLAVCVSCCCCCSGAFLIEKISTFSYRANNNKYDEDVSFKSHTITFSANDVNDIWGI